MDGEQKFLITVISLGVMLLCLAYLVTFLALWPYRVWIAASFIVLLVALLVTFTLVKVRGSLTEQDLRQQRIRYHEELPLDRDGVPHYLPHDAQPNPQQNPVSSSPWYVGSQQQERGH